MRRGAMQLAVLTFWFCSAAALPQTYEELQHAATMHVGRTAAQLGIPSALARHTAGRDRQVDRATAEAAIRRVWLAMHGRFQHPSPAVEAEIDRIKRHQRQKSHGVNLLETKISQCEEWHVRDPEDMKKKREAVKKELQG